MKKFIPICLLFLLSCAKSPKTHDPVSVVTSIFPLADVASHLAGPDIQVFHLVPAGANPHTYEPAPADIQKLSRVRLFIGIHPDFDGWMEKHLPQNAQTVYLMKAHPHHHDHDHAHDLENPHIWLSPTAMRSHCQAMTQALKTMAPSYNEILNRNLMIYQDSLKTLNQELTLLFSPVGRAAFFQWHSAWDAFAEEFNLKIAGTLTHGHGDEPSVKEFGDLIQIAQNQEIKILVMGVNSTSRTAQAFSREIHGRILRLDTLGDPDDPVKNTYLKLMRDNARKLAAALSE